MNFTATLKRRLADPFRTFKIYERIIAVVCILIPVVLRIFDTDTVYPKKVKLTAIDMIKDSIPAMISDSTKLIMKDRMGFRLSISDYVYSFNSYLFGMLLCIAAMLFIFNGAVYFKSERTLQLNSKGKWYYVILGACLFGVICTPHRDHEFLHYTFAIIFFFGNAFVIGFFHAKNDKKKSIVMAILTVIFLILSIFIKQITLFWAEWLSLTVIGLHLYLESRPENTREGMHKNHNKIGDSPILQ